MNIAIGILVVLLLGFALFSIIKRSRRATAKRKKPDLYSTGMESGGLYYTSSEILDNDNHHQPNSSEGGADSSWGSDGGSGSGGDSGGGGDGGGGGGE